MNLNRAKELADKGLITLNKHEELDLWICKYTNKVAYNDLWTPELMMCRGLVINEDRIVARPFKKFFNIGESRCYKPTVGEKFTVEEKMDGSLGIMFFYDKWIISTTGSFHSEQSDWANNFLNSRYSQLEKLDKECTYLFEIIYPDNRIVVNYEDKEDLVLLGKINTKTGEHLNIKHYNNLFTIVEKYDFDDYTKLKDLNLENKEGFIIKWAGGMAKVKFPNYLKMHSIVTNCSSYDIYNRLKSGNSIEHLLEGVPDEFYNFVTQESFKIEQKYKKELEEVRKNYFEILHKLVERKRFAILAKEYPNMDLIMKLFDLKDISDNIWRLCKPKYKKPFKSNKTLKNNSIRLKLPEKFGWATLDELSGFTFTSTKGSSSFHRTIRKIDYKQFEEENKNALKKF